MNANLTKRRPCCAQSMRMRVVAGLACLSVVPFAPGQEQSAESPLAFVKQNCLDCHSGTESEAGLDLSTLSMSLGNDAVFNNWVKIHDRVAAGEMPPPDAATLPESEVRTFVRQTANRLSRKQAELFATNGRVKARRLTKLQLERSLHDLLGIDIPLAVHLPDEPKVAGFTTVADGQAMSHFQLEQHLGLVDRALDEAFRRALTPPDEFRRELSARDVARTNPRRRCREPEMIDGKAVVWSSRLIFYGRLPVTTARRDGWYRFTVRASALNKPKDHGVWCTLRTGACVSSAPLLGWADSFEVTNEPQEWTFEGWLPRGHMFELRPGDSTLKMGRFQGGQVGAGEGGPQNLAGVAIHSAVLERIHRGPDDKQIHEWLFGDLKLQQDKRSEPPLLQSDSPREDLARLITAFAERAFRAPVSDDIVQPYIELAAANLAKSESLLAALRTGYRALLCSPRFMYFQESPGQLDDFELASRVSYFLWNSMPDEELLRAAADGRLSQPKVLAGQVERMLNDPRGQSFTKDFAAEWLDLDQIDFTEPDRRMFPGFDVVVQQSMLDETHTFLQTLLDNDLSVNRLIDSDFTFLNSRLARFYRIDGVEGDDLQRVSLKPDSHRGGVLTQGAILKVTANGTNTSPVLRGVWISERLLGTDIPPPPKGVPAIEPDIRGAKTIREMLAKHKADTSCASCHVKIDPPGFALENYDPAGQWRERYPGASRSKSGPAIDASFDLGKDQHFDNVEEFRKLILADPDKIAANVARKMLTYGTGAPVAFADRAAVDDIVKRTRDSEFGFRSLVHEVVASSVFQNK